MNIPGPYEIRWARISTSTFYVMNDGYVIIFETCGCYREIAVQFGEVVRHLNNDRHGRQGQRESHVQRIVSPIKSTAPDRMTVIESTMHHSQVISS